ncbi:DMT family transporter [Phreatobacter stygius]|uniref:DMT family transporter n=1 Tax=Phreatobacter stygius TaxID=1940610 RepID=A0A4D7BJS4_9HYPH|nr:DMT family transporter [Phreatobacter stygius]QCI68032.1 DMT family transporter [Phreatobacter stygius]
MAIDLSPDGSRSGGANWPGLGYAATVVALFAGFVLVSRLGLSTALPLTDLAAFRFGIGGLVLLPIVLRSGLAGLRPVQAIALALLGGLGFALLAYSGFALAPAAHGAVLLHGTLPLTTALVIWASGSGGRPRGGGLVLIACGIAAMAWDGLGQASWSLLAGDLCLVLASLCWSSYAIYVKRLDIPALQAAAIVAVISAIIYLPVYAVLPNRTLFQAAWSDLLAQAAWSDLLVQAAWSDLLVQAGFQGVVIGAVSIFVYTRAVALLGAADVALFTAAVPGLTALGGYLLLSEIPSGPSLAGVALVTGGMLIGLRKPKPR